MAVAAREMKAHEAAVMALPSGSKVRSIKCGGEPATILRRYTTRKGTPMIVVRQRRIKATSMEPYRVREYFEEFETPAGLWEAAN